MNDFFNMLNEMKKEKLDDSKVDEYEKKRQDEMRQERQMYIDMTTHAEYKQANYKKIDNRIIEFINNDKRFCWIHGVKGVGKTYSLYAVRNYYILEKGNTTFNVVMEGELDYDYNFKDINAVDNLCISDAKMKFLADYYFNLIDYCWKCHKKLYLTSTKKYSEWVKLLSNYNMESAEAIASRLSNVTDVIHLEGCDRRKGIK